MASLLDGCREHGFEMMTLIHGRVTTALGPGHASATIGSSGNASLVPTQSILIHVKARSVNQAPMAWLAKGSPGEARMNVREAMAPNVETVRPGQSVEEIVELMARRRIGYFPVCDRGLHHH